MFTVFRNFHVSQNYYYFIILGLPFLSCNLVHFTTKVNQHENCYHFIHFYTFQRLEEKVFLAPSCDLLVCELGALLAGFPCVYREVLSDQLITGWRRRRGRVLFFTCTCRANQITSFNAVQWLNFGGDSTFLVVDVIELDQMMLWNRIQLSLFLLDIDFHWWNM